MLQRCLGKETVLTYTDGVLTSAREKIFALDGVTVEHDYTDTLTYTDGALTGGGGKDGDSIMVKNTIFSQ